VVELKPGNPTDDYGRILGVCIACQDQYPRPLFTVLGLDIQVF